MTAHSQSLKNGQKLEKRSPEIRIDGTDLYFNNSGLFSENYLQHRLPNEKNDPYILEHWETEPLPEFSECYEWMLSTWEEYKDVFKNLDEAQLEDKWIRPILQRLGWKYEVQDRLQKRGKTQIPDYSLFADEKSYLNSKKAKSDDAYFQQVLSVADAKAMGINLDGKGRTNANPSYQIIRYMEDTGKTWGILTDGEYWRIYSLRSESKFSTYFEINIRKALATRNDERFKYFFNFFRKDAFVQKGPGQRSFLDVVYDYGEQYAEDVETQLQKRAFKITQAICRGFATQYTSLSEENLTEIYQHSLFYLFRLMFILNAEAKGIYDVNDVSDFFPSSLRNLAIQLKKDFELGRTWSNQGKSYQYINELMSLLEGGDKAIGISNLGSEAFSSSAKEYFKKKKIPDHLLNPAIVELACAYDERDELKFIDYRRLSPDHLGSLFEGLLEFKLTVASAKLVDTGEEILPWAEVPEDKKFALKECVIDKGDLYLQNGTGERKDTGSFYTPSYVVDYMVKTALAPLCEKKSLEEILNIKVCDPAMGSGHFLIGAIKYLEEKALEAIYENDNDSAVDRENLRWQILHNCVYGADLNPLAVELSKYSLWIYTVQKDHELEPLDDQLKSGDSLLSSEKDSVNALSWKSSFASVYKAGGFDALIGNPPYVARKNSDYVGKIGTVEGQGDLYLAFVDRALEENGIPLKTGGYLSFIVPDPMLIRGNAKASRKKIVSEHSLVKCMHINGVFDAGVSNVVLLIQRGVKKKDNTVEFCRIDSKELRAEFERKSEVPKAAFKNEIPQSAFMSDPDCGWTYLLEKADLARIAMMKLGGKKLSDYYEDGRGEETSKNKIRDNASRGGRPMLVGGEGPSTPQLRTPRPRRLVA
jgi:type I restriction-modification system DNA methylase subunit